jgi:hypothetical protein
MSTLISTVVSLVSLAAAFAALLYARQAVAESRASKNLSALMELHRQAMSDDYRELRGRLFYTGEFDELVTEPYGPRHEEIHRLLGLYEMVGAFTRHKLLDADLVFSLFPVSLIKCYDKTRPYIEYYRVKSSHPLYVHNFVWLAETLRQRATGGPRLS